MGIPQRRRTRACLVRSPAVRRVPVPPGAAGLVLAMVVPVQAQEPEPWACSPAGADFLVFTHGRSRGEVLLEPSLRTSDAASRPQVGAAAYVCTIDVSGRSGSLAVALPCIVGNQSGNRRWLAPAASSFEPVAISRP